MALGHVFVEVQDRQVLDHALKAIRAFPLLRSEITLRDLAAERFVGAVARGRDFDHDNVLASFGQGDAS